MNKLTFLEVLSTVLMHGIAPAEKKSRPLHALATERLLTNWGHPQRGWRAERSRRKHRDLERRRRRNRRR